MVERKKRNNIKEMPYIVLMAYLCGVLAILCEILCFVGEDVAGGIPISLALLYAFRLFAKIENPQHKHLINLWELSGLIWVFWGGLLFVHYFSHIFFNDAEMPKYVILVSFAFLIIGILHWKRRWGEESKEENLNAKKTT